MDTIVSRPPRSLFLPATSGAAGAALYLIAACTAGAPLAPDTALADVVARYADHRTGVLVGVVLSGIAVAALLAFLGKLRTIIADPGLAAVTTASWVALLTVIGAGTAPLTALTWRGAAEVDPATLGLAFDLANLSTYSLTAVVAAVSVVAPTFALQRAGLVPRWLLGLAAAEVAINAVELAGIGTRTGVNAAGYAAGIGPLLWMAWVTALSVTIARKRP